VNRVQFERVSKRYRLGERINLREAVSGAFHRALSQQERERTELWSLRDVDFTVADGEALGIVGRNGAGKSTLLKVISQVLKPTAGTARIRGRLAPILELGTGFDLELTGYENIYLNALLLGRSRREIDQKVDEIIDFSGLGDFVRSPIRNYSSGMFARLGFSIATAWVPDILILDEVLAVGDAQFTKKCEERMQRFHNSGTTVLLVSHNALAISANCTRCIWLDAGTIRLVGTPDEVLTRYAAGDGTEPVQRAAGHLPPG